MSTPAAPVTAKPTPLDKWRGLLPEGTLASLAPVFMKSLVPLSIVALALSAMVMMFLWQDQSSYKPVFGASEKVAAADMMAVLEAEQIPYRLHPDSGQVLVPDAQLGKVRMLLAAKGVVAKLPEGLELMDRDDPLGVTQFVQDVRFKRGLEGELAQSIVSLDPVASARVHLSIAKSSSFIVNDGEKSSASVVLVLKPGRSLGPEQIASVINMVAGSVAHLDPKNVSVIDQAGNFLSARVDLSQGPDAIQGNTSDVAKRYQDDTLRNVHDLLTPVLGAENYRVSVTAEVDNDQIEETREAYGDTPHVTNEAMRDERDADAVALGVPGSLSNRPVAVAASSPAGSAARKNATTRQYAYDRSVMQIKRSKGRLLKRSVAVVLNNTDRKTPWSAAELAQIDGILRNGLGLNAQRGDQLNVSALAFPVRPIPPVWWQQPDNVVQIGSKVFYLIGGLAAWFLLGRPLVRQVHRWLANRPQTTELATLLPLAGAAAQAAPACAASAWAAAPARPTRRMPARPCPRHKPASPRWPCRRPRRPQGPPCPPHRPACRPRRCWRTTTCRRRARPSM